MSESNVDVVADVSISENEQLENITTLLEVEKVAPHPFADFAGALSWPIPLTVAQQKEVLSATRVYLDSLDLISTPGAGVLDYLDAEEPLSNEALMHPPSALASLVASPRGQALGLAIQNRLNGIATDVSVREYALAGIHLSLHPGDIDQPSRSKVAGFDLTGEQLWGKPALAVFDNLADDLIKKHLSSRRLAGLTAALLLVRKAPEFLIEKLPDNLKYGTTAWFNLTVAARTIEAQTPGRVAYMTFAQVMASADNAALIDSQIAPQIHAAALLDWGVVNGVLQRNDNEQYTRKELEQVRIQFNQQLTDRLNTSILLNSELPSRKAIALERLRTTFKGDIPFEERLLQQPAVVAVEGIGLSPTLNGRYSLLDIVMMEGAKQYRWTTRDPRLLPLLGKINAPLELGVVDAFQTQFNNALSNLKQGARLLVKHLIAELPLQDRKNLEYGRVSFYQYKTYRLDLGFFGKSLKSTQGTLRVKAELGGESKLYEIDLKRGVIRTRTYDPAEASERTDAFVPSLQHTIEPFRLADEAKTRKLSSPGARTALVPASYSSERTELIADALVEHLDLDSNAILQAAKGQTTQDRENAAVQKFIDFLVDLVPFKSAITNFINGNYLDGAVDLFFDLLGFVTAGASTAARLTQVVGKSASALSRGLKAARIIGAFVIGELNPLSGLPALLAGGGKLIVKGLGFVGHRGLQQLNKLRGATDGYQLLQTISEKHGPTLVGTFRTGDHAIVGVGALKNDVWYPYNLDTGKLYGPPRNFEPRGVSWGGTLGADANSRLYVNFHNNIEYARHPKHLSDFELGYRQGRVLDISGYQPQMKFDDLIDLASQPGLMPAEIGALTKELKSRMVHDANYTCALLRQDVQGVNVKVISYSQGHYLAHVNLVSKGECAGLANAMALAVLNGNEERLLRNMTRAAKMPASPDAARFIGDLRSFHDTVNKKHTFHMRAAEKKWMQMKLLKHWKRLRRRTFSE
ncbi:MAG TPA: hypothetical protein VNV36_09865 [Pseudomonas sp.]|uniref:hypothetical protein n=1 Tax=Pseudomonas sp. TaxID=306 RepID=UPI002BB75F0F|nr:hypothetical protein [Pseudomonas sp.]HWH87069.1 hypothetical protein [Pseudomonas sp.]